MKKTILTLSALLLLSCGTRNVTKSATKEETVEVVTKKDTTSKNTERVEDINEEKKSEKETKNNIVTETKIIEIDGRIIEQRTIDNTVTNQVDVSNYQATISLLELEMSGMQLQIDKLSNKSDIKKETESKSYLCLIWFVVLFITVAIAWSLMKKKGWLK